MNVRNLLQNNSIGERSNWVAEVIVNNEYLSDLLSAKANSADLATVATSGSYTDLSNKPTKLSDFTNDSGFIDNTVNNLTNYYLSSDTYTKTEVNNLISSIVTLNIVVVQTLPVSDISTHTIYLVPKTTAGTDNVYDEYINTDGTSAGWELIGSTEVDLSNYYTKNEIDLKVADLTASILRIDGDVDSIELDIADLQASVLRVEGEIPTYTEGDGIDISSSDVISVDTVFSDASTRTNIASGDSFSTILGKIKKFFADLKSVAFSGSYTDLSDKPTIPTVNNGTLTIQKNGTSVQTFTANQSTNATANITVPTDTNELTNGAGFITSSGSCAYATSAGSASDSTKVAKAGDTMTGTLTVKTSSDTPIRSARTGSGNTYHGFYNSGTTSLGFYGVNTSKHAIFQPSGGSDQRIHRRTTDWTGSNYWTYYKDDGGYYHLHYAGPAISRNFNQTFGNGYMVSSVEYINFPVTLNSAKSTVVSLICGSNLATATIQSINTQKIGLYLWAMKSGTYTIHINIDMLST